MSEFFMYIVFKSDTIKTSMKKIFVTSVLCVMSLFVFLSTSAQSSPAFAFKQSVYSVTEGSSVRVTVVAPENLSRTTRVSVRIEADTAKAGSDYISPRNVTLTFYKGGLKEKSILIRAKTDSIQEPMESLNVRSTMIATTATVQITDRGSTASQATQITCPDPYVAIDVKNNGVFKTFKPTLIKRSYSYIPWGPTALFGQGVPSFPGPTGATYGAMRPANDPAVIQTGTIEAYEFTGPAKTWPGTEHNVAFYTAEAMDFPPGTSYEVRKGKASVSDGEIQFAPSPQGSTCGATFAVSIDQCPGIVDSRRDTVRRRCTAYGGEISVAWTTPGAQFGFGGPNDIYNGVRVPSQYPYTSLSDTSCLLETGKKYYLNISAVGLHEILPNTPPENCPLGEGTMGIRMINRSGARISP